MNNAENKPPIGIYNSTMGNIWEIFYAPEPEPVRPRIDRSMIGNPSGFRHVNHVGASDANQAASNTGLTQQMNSKVGESPGLDRTFSIPHIENATPIVSKQISVN